MGVVGLSVLVFLILDNLDTHRESKETLKHIGGISDSEIKGTDQSVGGGGGGGGGDDEKEVVSEHLEGEYSQEIQDRKETDNLVNTSCGKSDSLGDVCREREGIMRMII